MGTTTVTSATSAQTIAGVERALDVLSLFAGDGTSDLGVTEIAEQLELSKAVVHRILASCRVKGYVDLDEQSRRYRLGPAALNLGLSYLNRVDVMAEARAALDRLCRMTDETATHSVRAGLRRVYVDQVTPARDIKMVVQIGASYPLHAGASSKAMLSFLSEELREAYLLSQPMEQLTDETITDVDGLRDEMTLIRERGYAISLGERQPGAGSVAAPVFDHSGQVVASLSVCGPLERFREELEPCAEALLEVTQDLSARLGYKRPKAAEVPA